MDRGHKKQKSEIDGYSQPVPMHVAASLVYHQLNRKLDLGVTVNGALNSTALALSQVSEVYFLEDGKPVPISRADLASGAFEDSAETYRAASGRVYRSLSMRRGDLMEAITILRRARATGSNPQA